MKRGLVNIVTAVSQSEKCTCKGEPIRRQRTGGVSSAYKAQHTRKATNTTLHISLLTLISKLKILITATQRANWEQVYESSGKNGSETLEIHTHTERNKP